MTDIETTALKENFVTYGSHQQEAHHATQGHMGKHSGWSGGRRNMEQAWPGTFIVVTKERNGEDRVGKCEQV